MKFNMTLLLLLWSSPAHPHLSYIPDERRLSIRVESGVWMIHAAPEPCNRSGGYVPVVMAMLDNHEIFNQGFRCLDKPESRLSIINIEFRYANNVFKYKGYKSHIDSCSKRNEIMHSKVGLNIYPTISMEFQDEAAGNTDKKNEEQENSQAQETI